MSSKYLKPKNKERFVTGKFAPSDYTPQKLYRNYSVVDVRTEYMRLRDINRKRLQRALSANLITEKAAKRILTKYGTASSMNDPTLRAKTVELYNRLSQWETTLQGRRRHQELEANLFENIGITWASSENVLMIQSFLEVVRDKELEKRGIGSPRWIEYLSRLKEQPKGDVDDWVRNYFKYLRSLEMEDTRKWGF